MIHYGELMSLIPYNRKRDAALASAAGIANFVRSNPQVVEAILSKGKKAINGLLFPTAPASTNQRAISFSSPPTSYRKSRKRRARRSKGMIENASVPRSPSVLEPRICTTQVATLATNGAGTFSQVAWAGAKDTAAWQYFSANTQFASLASMFSYMEINRLTVVYKPSTSFSTGGYLSIGFVDDPTFTVATLTAALSHQYNIQKTQSVSGDVKTEHRLVWVPRTQEDRESKSTGDASGISGPTRRTFGCGFFGIYINSNALSSNIGVLEITADVTFKGLI